MKTVKVSKLMYPFICSVLKRDQIVHQFIEKDGNIYLQLPGLTGKDFTIIMEDALCEKQRAETKAEVPVYSYRTLNNKSKRNRLMQMNQKRGFHILHCDQAKLSQFAS